MRLCARLRDEVYRVGRRAPGRIAAQFRVVAAAPARRRVDGLSVDVDMATVAIRRRYHISKICCGATIILIVQTAAAALAVANFARAVDRGGSRRWPIEPVENKQNDPPLAGLGGG